MEKAEGGVTPPGGGREDMSRSSAGRRQALGARRGDARTGSARGGAERRSAEAGLTLVELMIAMVVASIAIAAALAMAFFADERLSRSPPGDGG